MRRLHCNALQKPAHAAIFVSRLPPGPVLSLSLPAALHCGAALHVHTPHCTRVGRLVAFHRYR